MILSLVNCLQGFGFHLPRVFSYYSSRMVLASVTSLCLSIFLGPWFIRKLYELRIGQPVRKGDFLLAQLHEKKNDTPTMGGLLILVSMLLSMLLWMDLTHAFTLILLLTTLVLGSVGAYDDWLKLRHKNSKGLSGRRKLLVQFGFATLVAAYLLSPSIQEGLQLAIGLKAPYAKDVVSGQVQEVLGANDYISRVYVPFFKHPVLVFSGWSLLVLVAFFLFVVTGSSNAVNLTDGLDGLAAGCLIMVAGTLACFAFVSNHVGIADYLHILYIEGSGEIAIYLAALVGACLGFLWYNGHPAQVFMG
ncbi:MAG: phospho-N-acetylmuramoyl-pentapeptide-transferase, partial [Chlamydiia bacterium]|nr:phospho-N-acetylmuramoyl-pentapeptide-transferase [Chlamydiia bacterium]